MIKFSQQLQHFLDINNLKYIDTIYKNKRKKTSVLIVEGDKTKYVLKMIETNTPDEIKKKFYNEVNFYKKNDFHFLPNYIYSTEHILQMEFVEAITLREYLIKHKINEQQISSLFEKVFQLYENVKKNEVSNEKKDFNNAYAHLGALATSGPMETKEMPVSLSDKIFSKVFLKILRYKLNNVLKEIDIKKLRTRFSHGDMHYNNILITSSGDIKLIDFENINDNGFYDFDLIYLYVMIELFLNDKKFEEIKARIISKICIKESSLLDVIDIYRVAILLNKKFQVGLNIQHSKIKLLINAIVKRSDIQFKNNFNIMKHFLGQHL